MTEPIFKTALNFVLKWEGGFVDNPKDPGGATNHGITQQTYNKYRTLQKLSCQSVKNLSSSEVETIYFNFYWEPPGCSVLPPTIAIVVFNCAVNMGVSQAQNLLHKIPSDPFLFLDEQELMYRHIGKNPKLHDFLSGWINRTEELRKLIKGL